MPLLDPSTLGLPAGAVVATPVPAWGLVLYRLLEHDVPRERDFEPHLTRSQARLRRVPELLRVSLSAWLTLDAAVARSTRRRTCVARLELADDGLMRVAVTGRAGAGHVEVWGHPRDVLAAVASVEIVTRLV